MAQANSKLYTLEKRVAMSKKEAGIVKSTLGLGAVGASGISKALLFAATAPIFVGGPVGMMYSSITAPSEDDLEDAQTEALTQETDLLTERLKEVKARAVKKSHSDVSWRGGFR